jgi:hypothetical protein
VAMKSKIFLIGLVAAMLVFSSCNMSGGGSADRFNYSLQGTWVSQKVTINHNLFIPPTDIIITLEIRYDSIKITETKTGTETGTLPQGYALAGFTNDYPLKAYSKETKNKIDEKEGSIFIYDRGKLQDEISYTYWEGANYSDKFITLPGSKEMTFKLQSNY